MEFEDSFFRLDHFHYRGNYYPLADSHRNIFNLEIKTTFGLRKTIIVSSETDESQLAKSDLPGLSGFVAFDLEVPFDWQSLTGHQRTADLTSEDDVCICTDYHQFATRQFLDFVQQKENLYRIRTAWILEDIPDSPATTDGWYSYQGVTLYVDDKIFGAEHRELIEKYGETEIPSELTEDLDDRIKAYAWKVLCELSPNAKSQYEQPVVKPGNYCTFKPMLV